MEADQELRFVCKLCNKKYPCGKSLGGHVRSHVVANSVASEEKADANMKKMSPFDVVGHQTTVNEPKVAEFGTGQYSYGLRENPKKTWRAVDSIHLVPQERVCKQCGKGFQSLKALCGHMACHSERDRGLKNDHSWTTENQKMAMDSHSDTEAEDRILRTRSSKTKGYNKITVKSPLSNDGSSSVSEIDGEDQEEVARCLMLLSRDSGNSVVKSSDNNSVVLEIKSFPIDMRIGMRESLRKVRKQDEIPWVKKIGDRALGAKIAQMENSDSGYFLDECAKAESDASVDGFHGNGSFSGYNKPTFRGRGGKFGAESKQCLKRNKSFRAEFKREWTQEHEYDYVAMASNSARLGSINGPNTEVCDTFHKRSKYECFNCKKTFKSYQALGGHRPCHRRRNALYESRHETAENSRGDSEPASNRKTSAKNSSHCAGKTIKATKNKAHVCPFCDRIFKNGQALGGHKRSHFIGGNDRSPATKPDSLDLNLPVPEEDENNVHDQFSPW